MRDIGHALVGCVFILAVGCGLVGFVMGTMSLFCGLAPGSQLGILSAMLFAIMWTSFVGLGSELTAIFVEWRKSRKMGGSDV